MKLKHTHMIRNTETLQMLPEKTEVSVIYHLTNEHRMTSLTSWIQHSGFDISSRRVSLGAGIQQKSHCLETIQMLYNRHCGGLNVWERWQTLFILPGAGVRFSPPHAVLNVVLKFNCMIGVGQKVQIQKLIVDDVNHQIELNYVWLME